ncbi:MAG: pyridoxamine 5'-phosphate oxidase family protein [Actinomycetia bacterium]|nr:pyridoxamine 5'-phosphate oxidase family protein [Actinomycetes bacterium]
MTDDQPAAGTLYPLGARQLQDQFDARRLADRMAEVIMAEELDERQRRFIEEQSFFHLATVDSDGFPDVSYKGGAPGFVRCPDSKTIHYPNYDGNGMYRSLGNIVDTGRVALLFSRFGARATRMRIHGTAIVRTDPEVVDTFPSGDAVVEITVARIFPNCPRYLHDLEAGTLSPSAPRPGHEPPEPDWKDTDQFRHVLPGTDC